MLNFGVFAPGKFPAVYQRGNRLVATTSDVQFVDKLGYYIFLYLSIKSS